MISFFMYRRERTPVRPRSREQQQNGSEAILTQIFKWLNSIFYGHFNQIISACSAHMFEMCIDTYTERDTRTKLVVCRIFFLLLTMAHEVVCEFDDSPININASNLNAKSHTTKSQWTNDHMIIMSVSTAAAAVVSLESLWILKYNKKVVEKLLTTSIMRIYCYYWALTSNQQKH